MNPVGPVRVPISAIPKRRVRSEGQGTGGTVGKTSPDEQHPKDLRTEGAEATDAKRASTTSKCHKLAWVPQAEIGRASLLVRDSVVVCNSPARLPSLQQPINVT